MAVVAILAGLLLPALGRAKGRALASQCANNLKQVGLATLIYSQDFGGRIQIDVPLEPDKTWASILNDHQKLRALDIFLCPSYAPKRYTNWWFTYGVRQDPLPEYTQGEWHEILNLNLLPRPTEYLHLTDTTSRGRRGAGAVQYYYFRADHEKEVHARHDGRVNGFFPDGHVEACPRVRLEGLGIQALFGQDTVPGYFQP
jgi:prepilin-type processing-associated H-X9-DG protein